MRKWSRVVFFVALHNSAANAFFRTPPNIYRVPVSRLTTVSQEPLRRRDVSVSLNVDFNSIQGHALVGIFMMLTLVYHVFLVH